MAARMDDIDADTGIIPEAVTVIDKDKAHEITVGEK